jgi:hypothetical protein
MKIVFFLATLLVASCAFNPNVGMSLSDWQQECRAKNWTSGHLIKAEGSSAVYYCDNVYVHHYFENSVLVEIKQGNWGGSSVAVEVDTLPSE